ncbi:MAG TPA: hypothetical protein VFF05_01935, partial [Rudaea sp.]|nr:hypothetical protein [Rudaea sp.]
AFVLLVAISPVVSVMWLGRYQPLFVEFVALLAAGWLVNVLSNPAYVVDLGTGALRWVSRGCLLTAALNAGLGFAAGKMFGGPAIVLAAVVSLISGYAVILGAYHVQNRVPFRELIPPASAGILAASGGVALLIFPFVRASHAGSFSAARVAWGLTVALVMLIVPMWTHPMRRRVWNWVTSGAAA